MTNSGRRLSHPPNSVKRTGTYSRGATTLVVVHAKADGATGLGLHPSGGLDRLVGSRTSAQGTEWRDSFDIPGTWMAHLDGRRAQRA